jgi:hypothetical protein
MILSMRGPSAGGAHSEREESLMASMLIRFDLDDYDAWKQVFDSDPAGRRQSATAHTILRGVDEPGAVFVRVEFGSVDEARAFRQRLLDSGALGSFAPTVHPIVVEVVEQVGY